MILIGVTGIARLLYGNLFNADLFFNTSFGQILLAKILLFAITFIVGGIITLTSKRMSEMSMEKDLDKIMKTLENRIKTLAKLNIALGATIIFLTVML